MHKLTADEISALDLTAFENKELERLGMPKGIVMRHRPAHFQRTYQPYEQISFHSVLALLNLNKIFVSFLHLISMILDLFSASSYAAAYYVYLWAEVLDAGRVSSHPTPRTPPLYLRCLSPLLVFHLSRRV